MGKHYRTDIAKELSQRINMFKKKKLSEQVYQKLLSMISSGEFAVDSKLPSEPTLAERFDVSRPVIRQSLEMLRADGILYSRKGVGSFIKMVPDQAVFDVKGINSIAEIQRCFEFRISMEGECAYYAAMRREPKHLARIEAALEQMKALNTARQAGVNPDVEFHAAIADATENRFFMETMEYVRKSMVTSMNVTRLFTVQSSDQRMDLVQAEHEAIYEAIKEQDPERARSAMQRHLENAKERMFVGVT